MFELRIRSFRRVAITSATAQLLLCGCLVLLWVLPQSRSVSNRVVADAALAGTPAEARKHGMAWGCVVQVSTYSSLFVIYRFESKLMFIDCSQSFDAVKSKQLVDKIVSELQYNELISAVQADGLRSTGQTAVDVRVVPVAVAQNVLIMIAQVLLPTIVLGIASLCGCRTPVDDPTRIN